MRNCRFHPVKTKFYANTRNSRCIYKSLESNLTDILKIRGTVLCDVFQNRIYGITAVVHMLKMTRRNERHQQTAQV